jgi:hypothetical protein
MLPDPQHDLVDLIDDGCCITRVLDEVSWSLAGCVEGGDRLVEIRAGLLDLGGRAGQVG